mmetsp:Transcript_24591/g.59313  ORF Transcript_24591/g.59313 Transcript_24591/m.59313 type:complete len:212 (-) Transcript_24591:1306-1941(-)
MAHVAGVPRPRQPGERPAARGVHRPVARVGAVVGDGAGAHPAGDERAARHRHGARPGADDPTRVPALADVRDLREHGDRGDRLRHPGGGGHGDRDQPAVEADHPRVGGLPDHGGRHAQLLRHPVPRRAVPRGLHLRPHLDDDHLLLHQLEQVRRLRCRAAGEGVGRAVGAAVGGDAGGGDHRRGDHAAQSVPSLGPRPLAEGLSRQGPARL